LIGDRLTGTALHYLGDHTNARVRLEGMLAQYVAVDRLHIARFQIDQRLAGRVSLSNVLWTQGFPDQAVRATQNDLHDALAIDHALSICHVLAVSACPIALCVGDLTMARRFVAMLLDHSAKHSLTLWNTLGHYLKGTLLLEQGDFAGLPMLRTSFEWLREAKFGFRYQAFLGTFARGLGATGQAAEARKLIDEALEQADRNEQRWCMAELLRVKGDLFQLEKSAKAVGAAEDHYQRALEWARRQEALSWELRAATSLAKLWVQHGLTADADQLLSSVYNRFNEGFKTIDLKTARALIDEFRGTPMCSKPQC
jgi:predicted ATPase